MNINERVISREISPYIQVSFVLLLCLVAQIIQLALLLIPSLDIPSHFPWTISASSLLLYAVGNSILSLGSLNQNTYWGQSITSFMILVVGSILMAWASSGTGIFETKSFSWIYVVFSVGYLLFLSMVRAMRKIMKIAEDQERKVRGDQF